MSTANNRQIVLDTETTGMNMIGVHYEGHRIIEIGAVEVINRRLTGNNFHMYLKPIGWSIPKPLAYTALPMSFWLTSLRSARSPMSFSTTFAVLN